MKEQSRGVPPRNPPTTSHSPVPAPTNSVPPRNRANSGCVAAKQSRAGACRPGIRQEFPFRADPTSAVPAQPFRPPTATHQRGRPVSRLTGGQRLITSWYTDAG